MSETPRPRGREVDALLRLATLGCGEAVSALARLARRPVVVGPSKPGSGASADEARAALEGLGRDLLAVAFRLEGLVAGHLLVALPHGDAVRLAGALGTPVGEGGAWTGVAESAIMESGNIVGSAFVSAIAGAVKGRILLSVPSLLRGDARACLARLGDLPPGPTVATRFAAPGPDPLEGLILVMPDAAQLSTLLGTLQPG